MQVNSKKSTFSTNKPLLMSSPAVIDTDGYHPNRSTTTHRRSQYHKELLSRRKGGMILVGFRKKTRNSSDRVKLESSLAVAQRLVLVRLVEYVKDCGSRLHGMNIKPISPVKQRADFETRIFYKGCRRYILIVNTMEDRYTLGLFVFAEENFEGWVTRTIEISSSRVQTLDRVFHMRKKRLSLPVILRPGDAALFEIF